MTTLLTLKNLTFGYHQPLTAPLDLEVNAGESWAILGPNGCGKTTLLKTIIGFLPALSGHVTITPKTRLRYVAQRDDFNDLMPMRVMDFVAMGLDYGLSFLKPFAHFRHRKAIQLALEQAQCASFAKQNYFELSEGQKQRVHLARTLVSQAKLSLLDEPTSAMDPQRTQQFYTILREHTIKNNAATIAISHHFEPLKNTTSHLIVFTDEGIVTGATPSLLPSLSHLPPRPRHPHV